MQISRFTPPPRLLMGPGPSMVSPSVLQAMSMPLVGHLEGKITRIGLMGETSKPENVKTVLQALKTILKR